MARRKLLHRLIYGGNTTFRNYESACLEAVRERLSTAAQEVLDRQLAALENIQRFSDLKLTALHMAAPPESDLFADTRPELRIAKIKLLDPGNPALVATLVVHGGRLSSLEFRRSPRHLRQSDVEVSDVEILTDPMSADIVDRPAPIAVDRVMRISGLELSAQKVLPPRSPEEVERYLETLDAGTPDDYGELLRLTDGFVLGEWEFLGTASWNLVLEEILVVAAVHADGELALCFRADAYPPEVIAYDHIDDVSIATYPSFVQALIAVAKGD